MVNDGPTFPKNWLAEGLLDTEYKQYVLLAWLQRVKKEYDAARLYPALSEAIEAHRKISGVSAMRKAIDAKTLGEVTGIDWSSLTLKKKGHTSHPELNEYLSGLIEFALPRIEQSIHEGKSLYEWVEDHVEFDTVGLIPLYKDEGYLLVLEADEEGVLAFRYRKSVVEVESSPAHQLEMRLVDRTKRTLSHTLAQVKINLTRKFSDLPNPATYLFRSSMGFPLSETLLPIARRRLLRELSSLG